MRNRRVRQHAFEIALRDREQIPDPHREYRKNDQHLLPLFGQALETVNQQAHGHAERGEFRRGTDELGDRCCRTLVDVWQPHVERNEPEFERNSDHQKYQSECEQQPLGFEISDRDQEFRQVERASHPIEHRHPVQQQARGQRAQHEVFHRGFRGHHRVTLDRHQRI